MYPSKQRKGKPQVEREWAFALVHELDLWQKHWYFNAPGVVANDRPQPFTSKPS